MELFGYWQKHPPIHELMAAYVGFRADDMPSPEIREVNNRMASQTTPGAAPAKTFDQLPAHVQVWLGEIKKPAN